MRQTAIKLKLELAYPIDPMSVESLSSAVKAVGDLKAAAVEDGFTIIEASSRVGNVDIDAAGDVDGGDEAKE